MRCSQRRWRSAAGWGSSPIMISPAMEQNEQEWPRIVWRQAHIVRMVDLRIEVNMHDEPPTPYKWEIYRGDEPMWIERAVHGYRTSQEAEEAGHVALLRLMGRIKTLDKSDKS